MTAPQSAPRAEMPPAPDALGQVRTLFISDVHLGTPDCQAALLAKLLRRVRPERLYLVGDIVDLLAMRKRAVLDKDQQALVARVLRLARSGCEVIYIPGNHDAAFRRLCGLKLHNVSIERRAIHTTGSGRRLLAHRAVAAQAGRWHARLHPVAQSLVQPRAWHVRAAVLVAGQRAQAS